MRAAVIVIDRGSVAVIERVRDGRRYYLFPGGGVEPGEAPASAAQREAVEELGLEVEIIRLVARAIFGGEEQLYYLARISSGVFGTGGGDEMSGEALPETGSYRAVLWPISNLSAIELRPAELARMVERAATSGWSAEVLALTG